MNYYNEIKNRLIDNEIYEKIKDYSKERNRVTTYYEIGKLLSEAGKHYGEDIIGKYSKRLVIEVGKKYNKKLLFKMRQLYFLLHNKKVAPMVRQLSWSHCLILLPIKILMRLTIISIKLVKEIYQKGNCKIQLNQMNMKD